MAKITNPQKYHFGAFELFEADQFVYQVERSRLEKGFVTLCRTDILQSKRLLPGSQMRLHVSAQRHIHYSDDYELIGAPANWLLEHGYTPDTV